MSLGLLSTISIINCLAIGASSHMITFASQISAAIPICSEISHSDDFETFNGILKRECDVLPPGISVIATPEVAIAKVTIPNKKKLIKNLQYIYFEKSLYMNC